MRFKLTLWALAGVLPLATMARAQSTGDSGTVKKEDVKTWILTIDGKEYEAHPATPTFGGDTGLFHLSSAYTLPKGKASFSLFRLNWDRDPKDVDISVHGLTLAYGATSKLELFGSLGLQHRVNTDARFQPGFVNDFPFAGTSATSPGWQTGFGDVKLGAKLKFLDDFSGDAVGLAAKAFVKLPTADEAKGLGTGKVSGGVALILSKTLNHGADIHGSLGFTANGDPDRVQIGNAFNWGVGINVPANRIFQIQAEVTGASYRGADFDQTNPIDLLIGPVIYIKGFFIRPALSWNLSFDDRGLNSSSKSYTGRNITIGYHPGIRGRAIAAPPPPPPPPPPPSNRPPTVTCDVDKATVAPGESVQARASGSDPDGDSISYTWSASAGRISGSGTTATLDTAGVAPSTISITVRASDGRGGTGEGTCRVRIEAPARRAEAQTLCNLSGFPRNLSRLNNVDKACLDDVASRLRQDPRSRVIVVGHADSTERRPEVIGRTRAEAVKEYLVKQRGVDESRISVRSAGASKPADTGTTVQARAKNRRVEVIFVPEGATAPEDNE